MLELWRPLLYYPLGLLPSVFFTLRIVIQWFQSEQKRESYAGRTFWRLSLAGNLLLLLHYLIQVQFPFAILQTANAFIAFRNLNLINRRKQISFKLSVIILAASLLFTTLLFYAQSTFIIGQIDWIRTPTKLWDTTRHHHHFTWHILGAIGATLFASRFWVQWIQAERSQKSELGPLFWWLSIVGSLLSLIYFVRIQDIVSISHYSFGLIPYARNLILISRKQFKARLNA